MTGKQFSHAFLISLWLLPVACSHESKAQRVRESVLAGSWYLKDPSKLEMRLDAYLERVGKVQLKGKPLAIIQPHAGFQYSGQAAAYGYKIIQGAPIARVVIMGLSHHVAFSGASIPQVDSYQTPLGRIRLDREACQQLLGTPLFNSVPGVHEREHSIEIQLPFLQRVLGNDFMIVPLAFGSLEEEEYALAAKEIKKLLDEKTLVVASSDFIHYGARFGYLPFEKGISTKIEETDQSAIQEILEKDFVGYQEVLKKTGATICGRVPIGVLLHLLPEDSKGTLLRYYRSGDLTGDWQSSVSYASILFTQGIGEKDISFSGSERERRESEMVNEEDQKALLTLARATLEGYVKDQKTPDTNRVAAAVSGASKKELGVFVTLKKHGKLRGCMGHLLPQGPLYQGVMANAVTACSRDPRFSPVQAEELKDTHVEISVLSPLRQVKDHNRIIPGWHGIVLKKGRNQSVYLPHVPLETGWELEETLDHLAVKAGLDAKAWRQGATFHVFEAQIFSEE